MNSIVRKEKNIFLKFSLIILVVLISFFIVYFISFGRSNLVVDVESVKKIEYSPKILGNLWSKKITFYHDDPYHYYSIPVSTDIPENLINVELYRYLTDNIKIKVTNDLTYSFQLKDTDNNGKIDTVSWIIPELSEVTFSVEGILSQSGQITTTTTQLIKSQTQEKAPVGLELMSNDEIVHIWNELSDYYINKTSGIQITNYYLDYWTDNVFCLWIKTPNDWIRRCFDNVTWTSTYVNGSDYVEDTDIFSYNEGSYSIIFKIRYYLGSFYDAINITVGMENIGQDIEDIYFGWLMKDIKINGTYKNDFIIINKSAPSDSIYYNLSEDLHENLNENNMYSRTFELWDSETEAWVDFEWTEKVTKGGESKYMPFTLVIDRSKFPEQPNVPIMLMNHIGGMSKNQEVYTDFWWSDAIKQNFTEGLDQLNEIGVWWDERKADSYNNGNELYGGDIKANIVMLPNGLVNTSLDVRRLNSNVSAAIVFQTIAHKFDCFTYPKPGDFDTLRNFDTLRCPENKTSIYTIWKDFAEKEVKLTERQTNTTYFFVYLLVDEKTGKLEDYTASSSPSEEKLYNRGRLKLSSVFNFDTFNTTHDFSINFSYTGNSHCIRFPIPKYNNVTFNITMLSKIANYTFGMKEFIDYEYIQGNSIIAKIRPYPCCGISGVTLQSGEVCSI